MFSSFAVPEPSIAGQKLYDLNLLFDVSGLWVEELLHDDFQGRNVLLLHEVKEVLGLY